MPDAASFSYAAIRGLIIDFDGTLARGSEPLPGLERFFAFLRAKGIAFTIATNNSVKTPEQYSAKLNGWGASVEASEVMTSAVAMAAHLAARLPSGSACYAIGETGLRSALEAAGFALAAGRERRVAAVVVGGDRQLTYGKLRDACHHILDGAAFYGTNPDLLVPTEEGLAPECGTILAALQAATGRAPVVVGKPEKPMLAAALSRMGLQPRETATLGDRLETDVLGGQRLGCSGILVTTGVDGPDAIPVKGIMPDAVAGNLHELVDEWQKQTS